MKFFCLFMVVTAILMAFNRAFGIDHSKEMTAIVVLAAMIGIEFQEIKNDH